MAGSLQTVSNVSSHSVTSLVWVTCRNPSIMTMVQMFVSEILSALRESVIYQNVAVDLTVVWEENPL